MDRRFAVTGTSGFVGGRLTEHLLNQGPVLGISRSPFSISHKNLTALAHDIREPFPEIRAFRGATIIHAAAVMNSSDRSLLWSANVEGTRQTLEWAVRQEARRFVLFSSGGVYGYAKDHLWQEMEPTRPIGFYGHTKLIAENVARAYHEIHGIPVTVIRLFFPYGQGQKRGIFRLISDSVQSGAALTVNPGGAPKINPIHIDDVAAAIDSLLPQSGGFEIFNLCGDETVSFLDLVRLFEEKHHKNAVLKHSNQNHDDLLGSNARLKEDTGWRPVQRLAA